MKATLVLSDEFPVIECECGMRFMYFYVDHINEEDDRLHAKFPQERARFCVYCGKKQQ